MFVYRNYFAQCQ